MTKMEQLGREALIQRDFQEAINLFKRALEFEHNAEIWGGMASAFEHLEAWPEAKWALYKALELNPNNTQMLALEQRINGKKSQKISGRKGNSFRIHNNYFEKREGKGWSKFLIKGVNLGLGLPGHFPGEFAIYKGTYLQWFKMMVEAGFNTVRVYTLHPPSFYDALGEFNAQSHEKLYLIQEIWLELPENSDFEGSEYDVYVKEQVGNAIDAVHGNLVLTEKRGYPSGSYRTDLSGWVHSWLLGREWEPCSVALYNKQRDNERCHYAGKYFKIVDGTPFEAWITKTCDWIQRYEKERYGEERLVSVVNWPTLDPLEHWSESTYYDGLKHQGLLFSPPNACHMDEDTEQLDLSKIEVLEGSGVYATYHVYPYYPDFLAVEGIETGDPYAYYLKKLRTHHISMPIVIGEFGVPSSRNPAHWHPLGWYHGGVNEREQGKINVRMMQSIYSVGMAGAVVFSWFDEWFKNNRLFVPYHLPSERRALWFNSQNAEQTFGLLGMYPNYPRKRCSLSAKNDEWETAQTIYENFRVMNDEGFLYFRWVLKESIDFEKRSFLIGLGTCGDNEGEYRLPIKSKVLSPIPLNFMIELSGKNSSRVLIAASYDKYLNHERKVIRPVRSIQGNWVEMVECINERRLSKDLKTFYPPRFSNVSRLRFGSLEPTNPDFNTLSDFYVDKNTVEIRLPWALLNVTDPSSKSVLWKDGQEQYRRSDGIYIVLAASEQKENGDQIIYFFPESQKKESVEKYRWMGWETPTYHTEKKESFEIMKTYLQSIRENYP